MDPLPVKDCIFPVHNGSLACFSANYCGTCSAKWTMNGEDVTETCLKSSQSAASSQSSFGVTSVQSNSVQTAKLPKPASTGTVLDTDDCYQFLSLVCAQTILRSNRLKTYVVYACSPCLAVAVNLASASQKKKKPIKDGRKKEGGKRRRRRN